MEALAGVKDGDKVVVNPTDDLQEGMQVKTQQATVAAAGGANPGAGAQPAGSPKAQ